MNKNNSFLLLLVLLPFLAWTQQRGTGLILEDTSYQNIPRLESDGGKFDIPNKRVSLKQYCPRPGDQGYISSCVAWAVGYGAFTISQAIEHQQTNQEVITLGAYSASFIYNQIKKDSCFSGITLPDAFNFLKNTGDCLAISFENSEDCHKAPLPKNMDEAAKFRIKDYITLFQAQDAPRLKIDRTCRMLALHLPVVVGLRIPESFENIQSGDIKWRPKKEEIITDNPHAMVVIAYDPFKKEVELMNSYGPNWGNQGFIKLGYDDYARLADCGFVMTTKEKAQPYIDWLQEQYVAVKKRVFGTGLPSNQVKGLFALRQLMTTFDKVPIAFRFDTLQQVYTAFQKKWQIDDVFQIVAKNNTSQDYIYVLAMDGQGKIHVLFKTNADALNPKKEESELVLPSTTEIYQVTQRGDNMLCILYGKQAITDFDARIKRLQLTSDAFQTRIRSVFKDFLVPADAIRYAPNDLYFCAFPEKKSFVPVFIKQEVK